MEQYMPTIELYEQHNEKVMFFSGAPECNLTRSQESESWHQFSCHRSVSHLWHQFRTRLFFFYKKSFQKAWPGSGTYGAGYRFQDPSSCFCGGLMHTLQLHAHVHVHAFPMWAAAPTPWGSVSVHATQYIPLHFPSPELTSQRRGAHQTQQRGQAQFSLVALQCIGREEK